MGAAGVMRRGGRLGTEAMASPRARECELPIGRLQGRGSVGYGGSGAPVSVRSPRQPIGCVGPPFGPWDRPERAVQAAIRVLLAGPITSIELLRRLLEAAALLVAVLEPRPSAAAAGPKYCPVGVLNTLNLRPGRS